jgi:hypothetical protein
MNVANPQVIEELASLTATGREGEIIYGIFNDQEFFEPRFADGTLHPALRELLLRDPLWSTPSAPAAKRYMLWANAQRDEQGTAEKEGYTVLRKRTLTPWEDVKGQELEEIDEGRRPNNR